VTETEQHAHTLAFQGAANRVVRALLRAPLLARLVGARLVTLYVVGRKSGKRYTVPVAYSRHGDALLFATEFRWVRNLRTGEPVEIRFKGRRRTADVVVTSDEAGVVADYGRLARDNHQFARFNRIALDAAGEPDPDDLRRCFTAGGRSVRLTPRR
jgi:deazaflavin-dependent oxidoreductase (nitroreductase family)